MNIKKIFKDVIQTINKRVNPTNPDTKQEISQENSINFIYKNNSNVFNIISNLTDEQMELFLIVLINDVGLECILSLIQSNYSEQFARVTANMEKKAAIFLNSQKQVQVIDDDEPIIPVIFTNE